jgi:hypothetical protein
LGFDQVQDFISSTMNLTAAQNVTNDRIMRAVTASSMREVVEGLAVGSTPMLAMNSTTSESTTLSLGLPPYQWQLEANYWHSVAMAQLQRTFVEYGTGQIAAQTTYILPPQTAAERWLCENLMIRGTAYQSFSVLALALIAGFGSLVIVVSLNIENLARYIQTRLKRGAAGREMWDDHDMLGRQLWRKAFEQQQQPPPPPPPSRSSSRTIVQTCYQNQKQKWQQPQSRNSSRTAVQRCYPGQRHESSRLLHAVSVTSYREGFMAASKGSWV